MRHGTRTMLMAAAFLALQTACQQTEDPSQTTEGSAMGDAATAPPPVEAERDQAMAQAESDYQAALRRCDMLAASQQTSCRDEAQSMLEAARRAAEGSPGPS